MIVEPETADLPAGEFSSWLREARQVQRHKDMGVEVPCGQCNSCCRSSMFIHVAPAETQTLARIPKALLFPAPGMPKGHQLMGYNERGQCPMLVNDRCSIYEHRPQTCRNYDCRVFAATRIELDPSAVGERVRRWKFVFGDDKARREHAAVCAAAQYLLEHRRSFPAGALPSHPAQLAALALRVYDVFCKLDEEGGNGERPPSHQIMQAVMDALQKFESGAD